MRLERVPRRVSASWPPPAAWVPTRRASPLTGRPEVSADRRHVRRRCRCLPLRPPERLYDAAEAHGHNLVLSPVTRGRDEHRAAQSLQDFRFDALNMLGPPTAEPLSPPDGCPSWWWAGMSITRPSMWSAPRTSAEWPRPSLSWSSSGIVVSPTSTVAPAPSPRLGGRARQGPHRPPGHRRSRATFDRGLGRQRGRSAVPYRSDKCRAGRRTDGSFRSGAGRRAHRGTPGLEP
jgi:hypothetical protein